MPNMRLKICSQTLVLTGFYCHKWYNICPAKVISLKEELNHFSRGIPNCGIGAEGGKEDVHTKHRKIQNQPVFALFFCLS